MRNRLPTKDNLVRKGVVLVDDLCPFCQELLETREHIFVTCRVAVEVRSELNKWWNIMVANGNSIEEMYLRLFEQSDNNRKRAIKDVVWHTYLWCMWKGRNAAVFSNAVLSPRMVAEEIKRFGFMWVQNRSSFGRSINWDDWSSKIYSL